MTTRTRLHNLAGLALAAFLAAATPGHAADSTDPQLFPLDN